MTPLPSNLQELTSVRALAAFIVVIFHQFFDAANPPSIGNNLIADGHLGVDLFFMLSGFILAHVYLSAWREGTFSYKRFLTNRFARLYPLHLTMTLIFVAAYQALAIMGAETVAEGQNWAHLPWHLALMHAWGVTDGHSWNFPSWSVSAETFAYLMFPISLTIALIFRPVVTLVLAICLFAAASLFTLAVLDRSITKLMFDFGIIRVMTEFLIGLAIYLVMEKRRLPDVWVRLCLWISVAAVGLLSAFQADERLIVMALAVFLATLAHLATQERSNILRHPVLIYLGEISYATYMVHILVLFAVPVVAQRVGGLSEQMTAVISITTIYVASAILYHLIERPGRRWIRRLLGSPA